MIAQAEIWRDSSVGWEHMVHTHGVEGSTPPLATLDEYPSYGILAQLGRASALQAEGHRFEPLYIPFSTEDIDKILLIEVENVRRICDADAHITA